MRAIEIAGHGGPEYFGSWTGPCPTAAPVKCSSASPRAGVNRPDVMQRMGKYPPPPGASDIPGLEVAGEVYETAGAGPIRNW